MHTASNISIYPLNENTVKVEFCEDSGAPTQNPSPELCQTIASFRSAIIELHPHVIADCTASYTSLLVYYDFLNLNTAELTKSILECWEKQKERSKHVTTPCKRIEIPVYYGQETGPDLEVIARTHRLTHEEVIRIHSEQIFTVYAIGFAPGFAYMGFVDDKIATPRLSQPRPKVAKGSVGIAGKQTGVYPKESPGGWNIIGRSATELIDLQNPTDSASLLHVGDRVRFTPVSRDDFIALGGNLT